MISGDWRIAQLALQIIAEQGPGLAFTRAEEQENARMTALARGFRG